MSELARIIELEQELEGIRASLAKLRLMHQEFVSATARGERDSIVRWLEAMAVGLPRDGRARDAIEVAILGIRNCADQE